MGWFFTAMFIYAGQAPIHETMGPYASEQACLVAAADLKAAIPLMRPTACTRERTKLKMLPAGR